MNNKLIIPFLPGYMWNGVSLETTGVAIYPTQHVNPRNGEIRYYVKPIGWPCGAYIRRNGIVDWIVKTCE